MERAAAAGKGLQQDSTKDDTRYREVDNQASDVHQRGNKWRGCAGRIETASAQDEWQHRPRGGAEHDYPYQAAPYGESDDRVVRPIGTSHSVPDKYPRHANDAEYPRPVRPLPLTRG